MPDFGRELSADYISIRRLAWADRRQCPNAADIENRMIYVSGWTHIWVNLGHSALGNDTISIRQICNRWVSLGLRCEP
jgi:hypothetical protein